jgi:hypothetical protein
VALQTDFLSSIQNPDPASGQNVANRHFFSVFCGRKLPVAYGPAFAISYAHQNSSTGKSALWDKLPKVGVYYLSPAAALITKRK